MPEPIAPRGSVRSWPRGQPIRRRRSSVGHIEGCILAVARLKDHAAQPWFTGRWPSGAVCTGHGTRPGRRCCRAGHRPAPRNARHAGCPRPGPGGRPRAREIRIDEVWKGSAGCWGETAQAVRAASSEMPRPTPPWSMPKGLRMPGTASTCSSILSAPREVTVSRESRDGSQEAEAAGSAGSVEPGGTPGK
jgi:hypothetical protein